MRASGGAAILALAALCAFLAAVYVFPDRSSLTIELSFEKLAKNYGLSQSQELKQKLAMTSSAMNKLSAAVEKAGSAPTAAERQDMMNGLNLVAGLLANQVKQVFFVDSWNPVY